MQALRANPELRLFLQSTLSIVGFLVLVALV
jgi:hypothetical protein